MVKIITYTAIRATVSDESLRMVLIVIMLPVLWEQEGATVAAPNLLAYIPKVVN